MKKFLLFASLLLMFSSLFAQEVTTLTFTAKQQNNAYQQLDSVVVTNLTREWTEVIYFPDTLLFMNTVGITDYQSDNGKVKLYQNIPNPFHGVTDFNLTLFNKEKVDLVIFDINGRKVAEYHNTLGSGEHMFRATMNTPQTYLLSAVTKNGNTSIKMINLSNTGEQARIEYISSQPLAMDMSRKQSQNPFGLGDNMQYVGYATQNDGSHDNTITQTQQGSETITFTFPTEVFDPIVKAFTDEPTEITLNTATLNGHYDVKYTTVTELGFAYKKSDVEKYDTVYVTSNNTPFNYSLKSLTDGTEYVYKAFVKADTIVAFGEEVKFTTEKIKETKVITGDVTDINKRGATLNGSYEVGNDVIAGLGFEYKVEGATKWEIKIAEKVESPFKATIENEFEPSTKVVYRAFAYNDKLDQFYGEEKTFTTQEVAPELATVTTDKYDIEKFDGMGVVLFGTVVSTGYCDMKEAGFYLGTEENPVKETNKIVIEDYKNLEYAVELLAPNTKYYFTAFATNAEGTSYGDVLSFSTREAKDLAKLEIVNVTPYSNSADVIANLIDAGGETITEKGICFGTKENPTIDDQKVLDSKVDVGEYTLAINGLEEEQDYYVRAYAVSYAGVAYSENVKFSTAKLSLPEVVTLSVPKTSGGSATILSKVMVRGGSANLEVGVLVSDTNSVPTLADMYFKGGAIENDSTYFTKVNQLKAETKYYARAFARNEKGEAFGNVIEFTTTKGFGCGDDIEDIEGNTYATVQIDAQCWMAENLRVKTTPDGKKMIDLNKSTLDSINAFKEVTHPTMGSFVYYTHNTAVYGTEANTDQTKVIRGICPEGWHIPSNREFITMIKYLDKDWKCTNENMVTRTDADAANSSNKLGIKLSSKKGEWFYRGVIENNVFTFSCPKPDENPGGHTYNPTPDAPGYSYPNYDDPEFNQTGFNSFPFGYLGDKDFKVYYNGSGTYWTSISNANNSYSNAFGPHYAKSGIDYSGSSTNGRVARGIRCICDKEFRDPVAPTVKTLEAADVTATEAKVMGQLVNEGYCDMQEVGFYFGTSEDPVSQGTKMTMDTILANFELVFDTLQYGTTYYFVAYATNVMGTSYGDVLSFTTKEEGKLPEVKILGQENLLATSVTINCEVLSDGNEILIERGLCYNTKGNPTTEDTTKLVAESAEIGTYSFDFADLKDNTTYYFRAYAINKIGTEYSEEFVLTMPEAKVPTVVLDSIYSVMTLTAMADADITSNGYCVITDAGVVYDTLENPTIEKAVVKTTVVDGKFTVTLDKLFAGYKFYARAYATNAMGTAYSNEISFTTDTSSSISNCGVLIDVDENKYPTKIYGSQCWMLENLRVKSLPDGTPMIELTTDNVSTAINAYKEVTDAVMGETFVYYTNATALNSLDANNDQTKMIQGICPEGWHIPSVHEFVLLFNSIDPDWTCRSEATTGADTKAAESDNKLGIKLASPKGSWYAQGLRSNTTRTFSCEKPEGASEEDTYNTKENTPGYSYPKYDDPDFNASEFNAMPFGYLSESDMQVYYNGTGTYWTSITSGSNKTSRAMGLHYAKTGVDYSASSSSGKAARGVRCVSDEVFQSYSKPVVETQATDEVTATTAILKGNVKNDGSCDMRFLGFYYGKTENPVKEGTKVNTTVSQQGEFVADIEDLEPNTTYYYIAYATNAMGTSYGEVMSLTTKDNATLPEVSTLEASNVMAYSLTMSGEVINDGNEVVSERGICFGTAAEPIAEDGNKVADQGTGLGQFAVNITGLNDNTTYYFRAYAVNRKGIAYGKDVQVDMPKAGLATISIDSIYKIMGKTAQADVTISDNGYVEITEAGVVFDTLVNPTTESNLVKSNVTEGSFTVKMTSLLPSHTYYVKAYAINGVGTAYSEEVTFTTDSNNTGVRDCGTLVDIDGNEYKTVIIGLQCWMKENLRVKTTPGGTKMAEMTTSNISQMNVCKEVEHPTMGSFVYYNYTTAVQSTSTNTNQTKIVRGICPEGWHIPSRDEFFTMYRTLDTSWNSSNPTVSTNKLGIKLAAKEGEWYFRGKLSNTVFEYATPEPAENPQGYKYYNTKDAPGYYYPDYNDEYDESGFSSMPFGYVDPADAQVCYNGSGSYWTSISSSTSSGCYGTGVHHNKTGIDYSTNNKNTVCRGIRCICDKEFKDPVKPTVETGEAIKIKSTEATLSGVLVSDGYCDIQEMGFYFGTEANPTTTGKKIAAELSPDNFYALCEELTPSTTYHFVAFAKNAQGTSYGKELTFVTRDPATLAEVKVDVKQITNVSAMATCEVVSDGNDDIIESGICYAMSENPTIDDQVIKIADAKVGTYKLAVKDLKVGDKYYFKAYVTNSKGIAYSEAMSLTMEQQSYDGKNCGTLVDIEGNEYKTTVIGEQCWMAENLRVKTTPDGEKMVELTKSNLYAINACAEIKHPTMGTFVYYTHNTAIFGTAANTDQTVVIRGICPEGWHIPSTREFITMLNYLDPEWKCGGERVTMGDEKAKYSDYKIGVRLSSPKGEWFYQDNGTNLEFSCPAPADAPSNYKYYNLVGSPGYTYPTYDDPDFNTTGFNSMPFGYFNGTVHYNGSGTYWTSISNSNNGYSNAFGPHFNRTGMDYSASSSSGTVARGVRCIKDTESPEEPEENTCVTGINIDGPGWDGDIIVHLEVDGKEVVTTKEGDLHEEFEGNNFKLIVEDVNVNGLDYAFGQYPDVILTVDFGAQFTFDTYDILNKIKESGNPMFAKFVVSYTCGDKELKIEMLKN